VPVHTRRILPQKLLRTACLVIMSAVVSLPGSAQNLTILHNFDLGADGGAPFAGVTLDHEGRIYGTTSDGGTRNGVVFRLVHSGTSWVLTPIHTFQGGADGADPYARVLFGPDGTLYGTTNYGGAGGAGTIYNLRPPASACHAVLCPWLETVIYSFSNGADGGYPYFGDLAFDQAGNIYGTTAGGGLNNNGVVYKLTRSQGGWSESVLYTFTGGDDGGAPMSGPVFDSAGNIYGVTIFGGAHGMGTVYELSPAQSGWTESTLYTFTDRDGGNPVGLTIDAHGNLFGMTGYFSGSGIAYELSPSNGNWTFTLLQTFPQGYEGPYDAPTLDAQGNLYGTLCCAPESNGGVFKLIPAGTLWNLSFLHIFDGENDGDGPIGGVTFDDQGNLYGTTDEGGNRVWGTVWEITP